MANERKNLLIRIDPTLHSALQRWADDDFRSLNAQIEYLLKQAVVARGIKLDKIEKQGKDSKESESK